MASSLHQMARLGLVREAENFFRETSDSEGRKAANALDGMQRTPLHLACWAGKVEMIKILLGNRAECMAGAQDGYTPLHFCAQSGCAEGCRLLLDAGAKVNAKLHKNKRTPLHLAAAKGHVEAAQVLVRAGANTTLENSKGERPIDLASSEPVRAVISGAEPISKTRSKSLDETKNTRADAAPPTEGGSPSRADDAGNEVERIEGQIPKRQDTTNGLHSVAERTDPGPPVDSGGVDSWRHGDKLTFVRPESITKTPDTTNGLDSVAESTIPGPPVDSGGVGAATPGTFLDDEGGGGKNGWDANRLGVPIPVVSVDDRETRGGASVGGKVVPGAGRGSLAERRRRKRKLAQAKNVEAAGESGGAGMKSVSLSHLQQDGDEV